MPAVAWVLLTTMRVAPAKAGMNKQPAPAIRFRYRSPRSFTGRTKFSAKALFLYHA
jgi:hypothetical protein